MFIMFGLRTLFNRLKHSWALNDSIHRTAYMDSFVRLGRGCALRAGSRVMGPVRTGDCVTFAENCIVRGDVIIGDRSYIGAGSLIENYTGQETRISIGKYSSIGPGVIIYGNTHRTDLPATGFLVQSAPEFDWAEKCGRTEIGHDVWLGAGSFIAPGLRIGHGAIVGAGAVVLHDVEPYEIVGGVPAKRIRMRFSSDVIDRLLELQWWDWPEEKLRAHADFFTRRLASVSDFPENGG